MCNVVRGAYYTAHRVQEWRFSYIKYECSFNCFLVFFTDNVNRKIGKLTLS